MKLEELPSVRRWCITKRKRRNKNMHKIIGISGKKGSGKDTFINVQPVFGSSTQSPTLMRFGLGDHVKEEVAMMLANDMSGGIAAYKEILAQMHDVDKKAFWRMILQWWGTEYAQLCPIEGTGRRFYQTYWVDKCIARIKEFQENFRGTTPYGVQAITDIRFPHEVVAVNNHRGLLVRIERDTGEQDSHASEVALDDYHGWHFKLLNDGSYDEMVDASLEVMNEIRVAPDPANLNLQYTRVYSAMNKEWSVEARTT